MERLIAKVARTTHGLALRVHLIARPRQLQARRSAQAKLAICDQAIDITYVRTWEGWLYLAILLDGYSRKVVGWAMADHLRTELATAALQMALETRRPPPRLIQHTDRGAQYTSTAYGALLAAHQARQSVGRPGSCWDCENGQAARCA
jgi:transposase InsO family protein